MSEMNEPKFKAGERVAYYSNQIERVPTIRTIERVTPSGRLVIEKSKYSKEGYATGTQGSWSRPYLAKLTPELELVIKRTKAIQYIQRFNFEALSAEEANEIAQRLFEILKAKPQK